VRDPRGQLLPVREKTASVRVKKVGQPDLTEVRTWGAHERRQRQASAEAYLTLSEV
jgi:hypothetical protein